ncbi:MAG: hypothetical protein JWM34_378 [Ilumatobacteraceae bacterium]|nr:hypothetical protein [Ilumatobacteraceae bacterium]
MLDRAAYLSTIETETNRLAAAAAAAGPGARVPTCPEWTVRDLVLHQGEVHRWATAVVAGAIPKPSAVPDDTLGPLPDDSGLLAWFADGSAALVAALRSAPDDLGAFMFLTDPPASPPLFWARRQAHETGMHRVDAESAAGTLTPFDPVTATDGIDEMLTGFVPRKHMTLRSPTVRTLAVQLTDRPEAWHLTVGPDPVVTLRTRVDAECIVRGTANDVHLALWNRLGAGSLTVSGDPSVLDLFQDTIRISWN